MNKILIFICYIGLSLSSSDFIFETIKNELVKIESDRSSILILYNNYNCHACFDSLFSQLNRNNKKLLENNIDLFLIIRCPKGSIARRIIVQSLENRFCGENIFFDIFMSDDSWPPKDLKGGIFGEFDVTTTPALVAIRSDSVRFLDYKETVSDSNCIYSLIKWFEER